MKNIYNAFPEDYMNSACQKALKNLSQGENVLISAMIGCGGKTFLNLFLLNCEKSKIFEEIQYYDPEVNSESLVNFVSNRIPQNKDVKVLFIVRLFNLLDNKNILLEKLSSLRQPKQKKILFLIITDHTGITKPDEYFGKSSPFFPSRQYIAPFNFEETTKMIGINNSFYGYGTQDVDIPRIYGLSGGIPRLIKHICKDLAERTADLKNTKKFLTNPTIFFQLNYLAKLLISVDTDKLIELKLIDENMNIKSLLLKEYFQTYKSDAIKQIYPQFSELEQKLTTYLYESDGKVIAIEKIEDLLEMNNLNSSYWSIYKQISRLKPKIKDRFELINIKGKGYLLRHKSNP